MQLLNAQEQVLILRLIDEVTAGQNKSSEEKIALQYRCAFDAAGINHCTVKG